MSVTLRQYLSIPYKLSGKSYRDETGKWIREFSFPELPNCIIHGINAVELVNNLDIKKICIITNMFIYKKHIPVPRAPLPKETGQELTLMEAGLREAIAMLDCDDGID